jgi:hypothetical protein
VVRCGSNRDLSVGKKKIAAAAQPKLFSARRVVVFLLAS